MEISILDYGVGNLNSIKNSLKHLNIKNRFINTKKQIKNSHSIILPGVGTFYHAMKNIKEKDLYDSLITHIKIKKKPVLGICLGMQLLFSESNEVTHQNGLNILKGKIKKINFVKKKNIHDLNVGWQKIQLKKKNILFNQIPNNENFYFLHSYAAYDLNKKNIIATYKENNRQIITAINKDNTFGVQFHPEKSGKYGLKILENFCKI
jgi:imidazole glycerol-phosphate synthase subunit HisH|tara:strand:+ start:1036 stop:1656 length:621 start_codon:yes stop_codon:yes gene_type:complete